MDTLATIGLGQRDRMKAARIPGPAMQEQCIDVTVECDDWVAAVDRSVVARGATPSVAPLLRGVMHQYAAMLVVGLGVVLIVVAPSERARIAALVYAVGLELCLGMSALYHRGRWSPLVRGRLCRADHCMIYLLIAGTATPVSVLAVSGGFGVGLLAAEWAGAAIGIGTSLVWRRAPVWAEVGPYLLLGWLGLAATPALLQRTGIPGVSLMLGGGALYTVGAICYALERPDPWPRVFGFHEVFHGFVTAAVGAQAVVVAGLVLAT